MTHPHPANHQLGDCHSGHGKDSGYEETPAPPEVSRPYALRNDVASDAATLHDIGVAGMAKPEAGVKGLMVWAGAKPT